MSIIVYLFLIILLLIIFVLLTAIVFTFKLKILSVDEKKEFKGIFTVKWLFLSRNFSIEEPKEKRPLFTEPEDYKKTEPSEQTEKGRDIEEKKPQLQTGKIEGKENIVEGKENIIEGKETIKVKEKPEDKEKIGLKDRIIGRIRGKKREEKEEKEKPQKGITTQDILRWGFEGLVSLRKPLFRLFSDLLKGINIKRLDSYFAFGLSDPADTGMLCGLIHSLAGMLYSRCKHCSFYINPVFMCPVLNYNGNGEIRVKIHSLIFPIIKFILNGKTLSFTYSIVKEILQRKWKSKWKSNS